MSSDATRPVTGALPLPGAWLGPGARIGDWLLGEPLGEGGTSVVWTATRQRDGFEQQAALKLLRTGAADARFVERFRRERQILVQLEHPNIVQLLDGGSTPDGVPWYAMRRIEGEPLTTWAARKPLDARLDALITVARAVAFAHQRLVVHCDLKPENVWVDAEGRPHVLDFGIARLLDESGQTGTVKMLTPRWAAPEQVRGEPVTTATDVHALGLLLWACLTGKGPRDGFTGAAVLQRALEPLEAPSHHDARCRGDLDAIVLRATAVDPADRYRGAAELAADLERHRRGELVQAREGVRWYLFSRWVRRHRTAVAAGVLGLGLLTGWAVTGSVQAERLARERDRAQQQAQRAEATLDLLVSLLEAADPAEARGEELTVAEVLGSGLRELEVRSHDPALVGEVRFAVGRVQLATGEVAAALESLERARHDLAAVHAPDHPLRLRAELLQLYIEATRDGYAEATLERAAAIVERIRALDDPPLLARSLLKLADLRATRGDLEQARELARTSARLAAGSDPRTATRARAIEGYVACRLDGDSAALERALDETVQALGTRLHPEVADVLHELTQCVDGHPKSRAWMEEVLALREKLYGEGWLLATSLNNFGLALEDEDRARSLELLARAMALASEARGAGDPEAARMAVNHAAVLVDGGRADEGRAELLALLEQSDLPPAVRARVLLHLGRAEKALGRPEQARTAWEEGLAAAGPEDPSHPRLQQALGSLRAARQGP